jgi:hypothetical protein
MWCIDSDDAFRLGRHQDHSSTCAVGEIPITFLKPHGTVRHEAAARPGIVPGDWSTCSIIFFARTRISFSSALP